MSKQRDLFRIFIATFFTSALLAGCATQYGQKTNLGNGGYSDKAIDKTSFYIEYRLSELDGTLNRTDQLEPLWKKRATDLCGSNDFYAKPVIKRLDQFGKENNFAFPAMVGVAYCNNKIADTRLSAPDAPYQQAQAIPVSNFAPRETNALWGYLSSRQFDKLDTAVSAMYADIHDHGDDEFNVENQMQAISRLAPSTEPLLTEWISHSPKLAQARLARAHYYFDYAWHKRGGGYWNQVPPDAQVMFIDLLKKARSDVDEVINMSPGLCEAHALRLSIAMNGKVGYTQKASDLFNDSLKQCPTSLMLHVTEFFNLYPQWNGSYEAMQVLVNNNDKVETLKPLKAWLIAYDANEAASKKDWTTALSKYDEALKIQKAVRFYVRKAEILEQQERYVEAIDNLSQAVQLAPYDVEPYQALVRCLSRQSRPLDALTASYYISRSNAFDTEAYVFQGWAFYEMRRYQDALDSYESALAISPENPFLLHRKRAAEYQLQIRKQEGATTATKTAI